MGKYKRNVAPAPILLCKVIFPLWAFTIFCTMDRPSPVPFTSLAWFWLVTLKKFIKDQLLILILQKEPEVQLYVAHHGIVVSVPADKEKKIDIFFEWVGEKFSVVVLIVGQ